MSGCAGSEAFALQVLGDSMEPEFAQGEIIIVEPGSTSEAGAYVIALHDNEYLFRQLAIKDGECHLRPLNREYPSVTIHKNMIKGRVISKSSGKGRRIKSYL